MPETACTIPTDILETLLGLAMQKENPDEIERACIKLVSREIEEVKRLAERKRATHNEIEDGGRPKKGRFRL